MRFWNSWWSITTLVIGLVLGPALLRSQITKEAFDSSAIKKIQEKRPNYIFLGNSLLQTRITPEYFEKLTHKSAYFFDLYGGGPYHWFAQLKNYIVASGWKPDAVFVFYHDNSLTYNSVFSGEYRKMAEPLLTDREPLYEELTAKNHNTWKAKTTDFLDMLYPVQIYNDKANRFLKRIAVAALLPEDIKFLISRILSNPLKRGALSFAEQENYNKREAFIEHLNEVLALKYFKSIPNATPGQTPEQYDFINQLSNSFLPSMLELARINKIKIIFVRIQPRPNRDGSSNITDLQKSYSTHLNNYLKDQGFDHWDLSTSPELTFNMYSDGDHIAWEFRDFSTELFVKKLHEEMQ